MKQGLLWLIGAWLALAGKAQSPSIPVCKDDNTLLWKISGKGLAKPSYLFGTLHLMCREDIHLSDPLKAALQQSEVLYMELKMDDPASMALMMDGMTMAGGRTLQALLTDSEYHRIELFFTDSLHLPLTVYQYYKPYFLLAAIYPALLPCKEVTGVEEVLTQQARQARKKIRGLETIGFQSSIFDSIPYTEQARELLNCIDSIQQNKKDFTTLLCLYKTQHLHDMAGLLSKSEFGTQEHEDLLIRDRNKKWLKQLIPVMKKQAVFIAVGAGHLVGEAGLIALLRKQGYIVQPLRNR